MLSAGQSTLTGLSGFQSYTATTPNLATFTASPSACFYFDRAGSLSPQFGATFQTQTVGGSSLPSVETHRTDWHPSACPTFRGWGGNAA